MNEGGRSSEAEGRNSSGRRVKGRFLGHTEACSLDRKSGGRKGKVCSGTGLRQWQKQRPRESTVADMYCTCPEGHAGCRNASWGRTDLM